jgi:hypothetical protein
MRTSKNLLLENVPQEKILHKRAAKITPGQEHLTFFEIVCGKNCYKWANFDIKVEKILGKRLKNGLQVGRKPILFPKCSCPGTARLSSTGFSGFSPRPPHIRSNQ